MRTALLVLLFSATLAAQSVTVDVAPTQDALLRLDSLNYSAAPNLSVYTWPSTKVADVTLLTFNLAVVPAGATIQSAILSLTLTAVDAGTEPTYTVTLHKMLVPVNVAQASGTSSGVAPWTLNPLCCGLDTMALGQSDISFARATAALDRVLGAKTWDATAIVQEWWATPATNFGLLLNPDVTKPADRFRTFASMESGAVASRPVLRVTYSTGPPQSDLLPTSLLRWDVPAATLLAAQALTYPIYVDNVRRTTVSTCLPSATPEGFTCDAVAPPSAVVPGTHTLEVASFDGTTEWRGTPIVTVVQLGPPAPLPAPPANLRIVR